MAEPRKTKDKPGPDAQGKAQPGEELAVALSYTPDSDQAPRVVAKGKGDVASKIIEIARENGVDVEQNADLATLLQAVDLEREIPPEAFAAVAEIIGYLYRANRGLDGTAQDTSKPEDA